MAIMAKKTGGDFVLPRAGLQNGVCSKVFDLGIQTTTYSNETKTQHKIMVLWELSEIINDPENENHGKRLIAHKEYTLSLNDKANLRKDLEMWRGRQFTPEELADGFDLEKLLGIPCTLTLVHKTSAAGNERADVASVAPPQAGVAKMVPELPEGWCPEWIQAKIKAGGETARGDMASTGAINDDDVPF